MQLFLPACNQHATHVFHSILIGHPVPIGFGIGIRVTDTSILTITRAQPDAQASPHLGRVAPRAAEPAATTNTVTN